MAGSLRPMNSPALFAAAMSLILFAGCRPTDSGNSQAVAPAPPAATTHTKEFEVRLVAALEIASPSTRDEALGKLAEDAAAAGESAVTAKAIRNIASPSDHDRHAAAAAVWLAKANQVEGGLEVARMISAPSTRDEALKLIATGSQSLPQSSR